MSVAVNNYLLEGITFFEKVLTSIPDDITSLDFLTQAYKKTEQTDLHASHLILLAKTYTTSADYAEASLLLPDLKALPQTPEVEMLIARISLFAELNQVPVKPATEAVTSASTSSPNTAPVDHDQTAESRQEEKVRIHSSQEIVLVQTWKSRNWIDDELAQKLRADLEIMASSQSRSTETISALLSLAEHDISKIDFILAQMAKEYTLPPIPVDAFATKPNVRALLPEAFMKLHGVFPFAEIGNTLLVAIMNPQSERLRRATHSLVQRECIFYLMHPTTFSQLFND